MELHINTIAILVAVIVNFFLGFLWYTPLFGKTWGREMGYSMTEKPDKSLMMRGLIFNVIGSILLAWVFANNIAAWNFVPGINEIGPFHKGFMAAFFTWLGFFFPGDLGSTVWQKHSWKVFWIDTGYHFVSLLVVALIITYWI